jgi:hypothetical protein
MYVVNTGTCKKVYLLAGLVLGGRVLAVRRLIEVGEALEARDLGLLNPGHLEIGVQGAGPLERLVCLDQEKEEEVKKGRAKVRDMRTERMNARKNGWKRGRTG